MTIPVGAGWNALCALPAAGSTAAPPNDGWGAWLVEPDKDDASGTIEGSVLATDAATSLIGTHLLNNSEIGGVNPPSFLTQR